MQIHLSRPGGQREGPFTVDQINADLAAKKYQDTDYWAWYEGLEAWVPLHSVPGVITLQGRGTAPAAPVPPPAKLEEAPRPAAAAVGEAAAGPAVESTKQVSSGMPAAALEQMFIFTSGEGPSTMKSPLTAVMVKEVTGETLESLRERVPRDVFGRCDIGDRLRKEGEVPASAWKAMSSLKPDIVSRAKEGAYRICVRTFNVDPSDVVALFLFYNKEKL